jgi:hypothetical protein
MTFGIAQVDLKRLSAHPDCGFILNIFHLGNDIYQTTMWHRWLTKLREDDPKNVKLVLGIRFYYMRLACSHVREGLKVIMKIPKHEYVHGLVSADPQGKEAIEYFAEFKPNGKYHDDFNKFVGIRNILTFHATTNELQKWYQLELDEKAKSDAVGSIYVPDENSAFMLRYGFIDELNLAIMQKHILKLTGSADESLQQALNLTFAICSKFIAIIDAVTEGVLRDFRPSPQP